MLNLLILTFLWAGDPNMVINSNEGGTGLPELREAEQAQYSTEYLAAKDSIESKGESDPTGLVAIINALEKSGQVKAEEIRELKALFEYHTGLKFRQQTSTEAKLNSKKTFVNPSDGSTYHLPEDPSFAGK